MQKKTKTNLLPVLIIMIASAIILTLGKKEDYTDFDITHYNKYNLVGFTVYAHKDTIDTNPDAKALFEEINYQLNYISQSFPADKLVILKTVPIWVEWKNIKKPITRFYDSKNLMEELEIPLIKNGGIEIVNSWLFLKERKEGQPLRLIHEMANAYRYKTNWDEYIKFSFDEARKKGLYLTVMNLEGRQVQSTAGRGYKEYFAELTEAYFAVNDQSPFKRETLKYYDPRGYKMIKDVWEKKVSSQ